MARDDNYFQGYDVTTGQPDIDPNLIPDPVWGTLARNPEFAAANFATPSFVNPSQGESLTIEQQQTNGTSTTISLDTLRKNLAESAAALFTQSQKEAGSDKVIDPAAVEQALKEIEALKNPSSEELKQIFEKAGIPVDKQLADKLFPVLADVAKGGDIASAIDDIKSQLSLGATFGQVSKEMAELANETLANLQAYNIGRKEGGIDQTALNDLQNKAEDKNSSKDDFFRQIYESAQDPMAKLAVMVIGALFFPQALESVMNKDQGKEQAVDGQTVQPATPEQKEAAAQVSNAVDTGMTLVQGMVAGLVPGGTAISTALGIAGDKLTAAIEQDPAALAAVVKQQAAQEANAAAASAEAYAAFRREEQGYNATVTSTESVKVPAGLEGALAEVASLGASLLKNMSGGAIDISAHNPFAPPAATPEVASNGREGTVQSL